MNYQTQVTYDSSSDCACCCQRCRCCCMIFPLGLLFIIGMVICIIGATGGGIDAAQSQIFMFSGIGVMLLSVLCCAGSLCASTTPPSSGTTQC